MDPHKNIFFYYRGPSDRTAEGAAVWDRQLENNTTKALVNLLELATPPAALVPFLKLVGVRVPGEEPQPRYFMSLQHAPEAAQRARRRVAVLLCPPRTRIHTGGRAGGRPDACIYCAARSTAVLIETKVVPHITRGQLAGHLRDAGWPASTPWRRVSWEELFRLFRSASVKVSRPVDQILLGQFLQYLELIGMAPFEGFSEQDFDFFVTSNEDYAPILRAKLQRFGVEVYSRLNLSLKRIYSEGPYVGRIAKKRQARGIWLGIRKPQDTKDALRHCNFTLELGAEALSINVVVRDGRHDQPRTAIGTLYNLLSRSPDALVGALYLGQEFFARVYDRQGAGGGRIMPGSEDWHLHAALRLDHPVEDVAGFLRRMLEVVPYPGIHIRREIPRWDPILRQSRPLIALTVNTIKRLLPILNCLEEASKQRRRQHMP